jgi:hypothetical protein
MKTLKKKLIIFSMLTTFFFTISGCGYLLYPQRRNNAGRVAAIDPLTVVMDCFWLFFFIIPGVIAITVDAITGGWNYGPGEDLLLKKEKSIDVKSGEQIIVKVKNFEKNKKISFKLIDKNGKRWNLNHKKSLKNNSYASVKILSLIPAGRSRLILNLNDKNSLNLNLNIKN